MAPSPPLSAYATPEAAEQGLRADYNARCDPAAQVVYAAVCKQTLDKIEVARAAESEAREAAAAQLAGAEARAQKMESMAAQADKEAAVPAGTVSKLVVHETGAGFASDCYSTVNSRGACTGYGTALAEAEAQVKADAEKQRKAQLDMSRKQFIEQAQTDPNNVCLKPEWLRRLFDDGNDIFAGQKFAFNPFVGALSGGGEPVKIVDLTELVTLRYQHDPLVLQCHGRWFFSDGEEAEATMTIRPNALGRPIVGIHKEPLTIPGPDERSAR